MSSTPTGTPVTDPANAALTDRAEHLTDSTPLGRAMPDWQPRAEPESVALQGNWCRLEPLAERHGDDLFAAVTAAGAGDRMRYLPESVPDRVQFDAWLQSRIPSTDPRFWAVLDAATGRCGGRQSLLRTDAPNGVTEIGHVLWGPGVARTRIATEALYLTAAYVFDTLGYRRFEWKCNAQNLPSRRAARRFGFAFEGLFRQHLIVKGVSRDTAWYAMTDDDWSRLRPTYQEWLAPANFTTTGDQLGPLAAHQVAGPDVTGDTAAQ